LLSFKLLSTYAWQPVSHVTKTTDLCQFCVNQNTSCSKYCLPTHWQTEGLAEALPDNIFLLSALHITYKIAAEMGQRYLNALAKYEDTIAQNVTENIYERHLRPIFMGASVE